MASLFCLFYFLFSIFVVENLRQMISEIRIYCRRGAGGMYRSGSPEEDECCHSVVRHVI